MILLDNPARFLGTLLLRLHIETATRRGGVLGLHLDDLDTELSVLLLREKGGTARWQPISPSSPEP